jgi:hypothetical protein
MIFTLYFFWWAKTHFEHFFAFQVACDGVQRDTLIWATTKSYGYELILRSNRWILARALVGQICWAMSPSNGSFMKDKISCDPNN